MHDLFVLWLLFSGAVIIVGLMHGSEKRRQNLVALEAAVEADRRAFRKMIRHATDEKSPETAPPRNRLQHIVCLAEKRLRELGKK